MRDVLSERQPMRPVFGLCSIPPLDPRTNMPPLHDMRYETMKSSGRPRSDESTSPLVRNRARRSSLGRVVQSLRCVPSQISARRRISSAHVLEGMQYSTKHRSGRSLANVAVKAPLCKTRKTETPVQSSKRYCHLSQLL